MLHLVLRLCGVIQSDIVCASHGADEVPASRSLCAIAMPGTVDALACVSHDVDIDSRCGVHAKGSMKPCDVECALSDSKFMVFFNDVM